MELTVVKRDNTLTPTVFKKGTVIDIDTDEMVAYHYGMQWKIKKLSDTEYSLLNGETVFKLL